MTLTSKYSWLYGQYPYDNDPTEGDNIPTDYAVECQCVPAQTNPAPVFAAPWRPLDVLIVAERARRAA